MKKVWIIVKEASLVNNDGCCIVSISIKPSNLTKASRMYGKSETNTTKMNGAKIARSSANHLINNDRFQQEVEIYCNIKVFTTYENSHHTRNDKQTYGYFSTGSAKNVNVSVNLSTLDSDDTNATGIVQKIHRVKVNTKLRNSPTIRKVRGESGRVRHTSYAQKVTLLTHWHMEGQQNTYPAY